MDPVSARMDIADRTRTSLPLCVSLVITAPCCEHELIKGGMMVDMPLPMRDFCGKKLPSTRVDYFSPSIDKAVYCV